MSNLLVDIRPFRPTLTESREKPGVFEVTGVLQRAGAKNQNGRIYTKPILERECQKYIKEFVEIEDVVNVEGYYFSNTIEQKPKGWRNGWYSGVTNEVGAHIIDLCVHIFGLSNPTIINKELQSIISDVDDILIADLEDKSIKYHFHFDWVNKDYRKPVFKFVITMKDGTVIRFDQQKAEFFNDNNLFKRISIVDIAQKVPFYLRGVDFTNQMQDFIGSKNTIASLSDALITRTVIKKLITR
jgi:predicted dehydrogenase